MLLITHGTYAEPIFSVLDEDVPDPPVSVEEPLDVALPHVGVQVAQEHAGRVLVSGRHREPDRRSQIR